LIFRRLDKVDPEAFAKHPSCAWRIAINCICADAILLSNENLILREKCTILDLTVRENIQFDAEANLVSENNRKVRWISINTVPGDTRLSVRKEEVQA